MKQRLIYFILFSFLISCKKDVGENQNLDPKDQKKYDLMTNKVGSWWLYGASDSSISKRFATGKDSTIKGLLFSYYLRIDTTTGYPTHEYFGKNANRYIALVDIDGSQTNYLTVIFFKDGVNVGATWTNTDQLSYSIFKFDVKVDSKVEDTGGIMTINGTTYTNVFRTRNTIKGKLSFEFDSDYKDAGIIEIWFVKGIGIIKQNMDINIASGVFTKTYRDSLLSYYFEPE